MARSTQLLIVILSLILLGAIFFIFTRPSNIEESQAPIQSVSPISKPAPQKQESESDNTPPTQPSFTEPIADFQNRITKKSFGVLIAPETSPVQPERFSGYHTAVDIEYSDISEDVPFFAIADGTVALARTASGYGGVLVIEHQFSDEKIYAVYGHINIDSINLSTGYLVVAGDYLGILGKGATAETDGERKHLHFGLRKAPLNIAGYVQSAKELSKWYDPVIFLNK